MGENISKNLEMILKLPKHISEIKFLQIVCEQKSVNNANLSVTLLFRKKLLQTKNEK